jgi:hypothetical protein
MKASMALFDEPSRRPLPKPTFEDAEHAGLRALVSMIPFVGGAGTELMNLMSSPISVRRDEWLEDLERRLFDLEGKVEGFQFVNLQRNEEFISATLQATVAAVRTHQSEKRDALRNAVLNVAVGATPGVYQGFFLSLVDSLTPMHLSMLKQFQRQQNVSIADAPGWLKSNVASQVAADLLDRGLIGPRNNAVVPNRRELIIGRDGVYSFEASLTWMGSEFLKFITGPTDTR